MIKPLNTLDIVISIFNQEKLIKKVLFGIFKNTTTPFNLILVFDGCTDQSESIVFSFIEKFRSPFLKQLVVKRAPNVYETRANNIGFKLAKEDFMITVQDDMVIQEFGWERRLTYPLRKFDNILAITARSAHNIKYIDANSETYENIAAKEHNTLPRNILAIRDIINRGPIAFRMDYLRKLNYLNEDYAPTMLDDAEVSLRAWVNYGWKVGSFYIKYLSRLEWGKTRSKDSTISVIKSNSKNAQKIANAFKNYLEANKKHTENISIEENEIDYTYTWQTRLRGAFYNLNYLYCVNRSDFVLLCIRLFGAIKNGSKDFILSLFNRFSPNNKVLIDKIGLKKFLKIKLEH